jgi:hypothetical protein
VKVIEDSDWLTFQVVDFVMIVRQVIYALVRESGEEIAPGIVIWATFWWQPKVREWEVLVSILQSLL